MGGNETPIWAGIKIHLFQSDCEQKGKTGYAQHRQMAIILSQLSLLGTYCAFLCLRYTWYMDLSGEECRSGLHIPVVSGKLIKHSFRKAV